MLETWVVIIAIIVRGFIYIWHDLIWEDLSSPTPKFIINMSKPVLNPIITSRYPHTLSRQNSKCLPSLQALTVSISHLACPLLFTEGRD